MIIYGTKGSLLNKERKNAIPCNRCHQTEAHNISIYGRYFYLYWIPFFPIGKKGFSECLNCKSTLEPQGMSPQLRNEYNRIDENTKSPITHWIGLLVIGIFFVFFMVAGMFS